MSKAEATSSAARDKNLLSSSSGLSINETYLRKNAEGFSLALKGQEVDIEFDKCNFYTDRKNASPQYVVNTYSVGTLESTLAKMIIPRDGDISVLRGPGVSVHYLINTDGTIYQLVPESKKPWATGVGDLVYKSKLNPKIENMKNGMNNFCISIMYINDGKSRLTDAQFEAGTKLTSDVVERNNIDSEKVIAFADWTPGRHIAPGPYFPWEGFAKQKLGLWSDVERKKDPEVIVSYKTKPILEDVDHIGQALEELAKKHSTISTKAGAVVQEYSQNFSVFRESVSKASHADLENVKEGLSKLGMVGVHISPHTSNYLDSVTLSSMLCFNLHHLGAQIIGNETLKHIYDNRLWADSSDPDARGILGEWSTNSQAVLDDLLG